MIVSLDVPGIAPVWGAWPRPLDYPYAMTTHSRAAFLAACTAWLFAAAVVPGAEPAAHPQDPAPPVFTSGVELVAVDFLALSPAGDPIVDLKAEEVTIKVDG